MATTSNQNTSNTKTHENANTDEAAQSESLHEGANESSGAQIDSRFVVDSHKLSASTSEKAFREGLVYSKEDRVIDQYAHQGTLYGTVEGSNPDWPYHVEVVAMDDGKLVSMCECDNVVDTLCKHGVATLLCYSQGCESELALGSAKDTAIRDRVKRGQTEVKVKHVDGLPSFGSWEAQSLVSSTHRQQSYRVLIRSLSEKMNYCDCPDLANNQLGTCKHIEAVLHHIGSQPQAKNQNKHTVKTPPIPFVYRSFEEDGGIWLQRTPSLSARLGAIADRFFSAEGRFKGQLPEDFFKFSDAIFGEDNLVIGEDVRKYASELVSAQAQASKADRIRLEVLQSGGRLPGIEAKLYPYQIEGVAFLAGNGRALLADDMGLGKTLQSIAAANYLVQRANVRRVLIVCPASLKHQWAREIEKFTGFKAQVVQGSAEQRLAQYRQDRTFFVMNYELASRDISVVNEVLKADLLILDEAQRIKNWRTKVANSIKAINSQYAFVLTGTPLENKLEELYSLMQVVDQNLLGPLWRYLSEYHIINEKGRVLGYRNLTDLRQRISHAMLRRNRSVVSDQLPSRTTTRLDVPMTNRQIELHDGAIGTANQLANISKKRPLTPSEGKRLMAALQQARMACDAAGLLDKETKGAPKLSELKNLVEQICIEGGLKMVVFSQWHLMTSMVEDMLKQMGVGCAHLHGGVPTSNRGHLMERFLTDDSCKVFVSTDAGGSGLNLQSASVLVNLDMPWNPAILEQRNARVHRLGQTNKVQIILMIAEDSYEQRVYELVNNKQDLFDNVIDPEGTEDIVGVSKKALEEVMGSLKAHNPKLDQADTADSPKTDVQKPAEPTNTREVILPPSLVSEEDTALKAGILEIQQYFGARLEQVVGKGGGLMLILSHLQEQDNNFIDTLSLQVPVALVDVKTLRQLQQLGVNPLMTEAEPVILPEPEQQAPALNPWLNQAKEKLKAAQTLVNQQVNSGVIELLCSAVASVITDKSNQSQLMPIEEVPVWLYGTGVPEELLTVEQAYTISRVVGLRQANIIPDNLLMQAYEDTSDLLEELVA